MHCFFLLHSALHAEALPFLRGLYCQGQYAIHTHTHFHFPVSLFQFHPKFSTFIGLFFSKCMLFVISTHFYFTLFPTNSKPTAARENTLSGNLTYEQISSLVDDLSSQMEQVNKFVCLIVTHLNTDIISHFYYSLFVCIVFV